jgi:hypothetical protein
LRGAIGAVHEDVDPAGEVGEAKKDRRPALGVQMSDDHCRPTLAGLGAVAPPSGAVVGARRRQNTVLVDGQRLHRRIDPDRRDPNAHRVSAHCLRRRWSAASGERDEEQQADEGRPEFDASLHRVCPVALDRAS